MYRKDPTGWGAKTAASKGWWTEYSRMTGIFQERKKSIDHAQYIRGKRRSILNMDSWDDTPRGRHGRSWKDNSKRRKQWKLNVL